MNTMTKIVLKRVFGWLVQNKIEVVRGQGKCRDGVLYHHYLRRSRIEISLIFLMGRGQNISYTYRILCEKAVKKQAEAV